MSPRLQSGVGRVIGLLHLACLLESVCGDEVRAAVCKKDLLRGEDRCRDRCSGGRLLSDEGRCCKDQQSDEKAKFHVQTDFPCDVFRRRTTRFLGKHQTLRARDRKTLSLLSKPPCLRIAREDGDVVPNLVG